MFLSFKQTQSCVVQVSCTFGLPVQVGRQGEELIGDNMDMVKNSKTYQKKLNW